MHKKIQQSSDYYDDVNEFNLKNKRMKNEQILQGKHLQEHKLYRHQTPYVDNEIYLGVDSIKAYVTAQSPRSEVYPASDKDESKVFATDLEKYHHAWAEKFQVALKLGGVVHNMESKYIAFLKLRWNPLYGQRGDIVPEVVDPNHVIVSKNAKQGENPEFICHVLMDTIEGLVSRFPTKEEEILQLFQIKRKGTQNISAEVAYREVWFTWYDDDHKPQEAVCWYVRNLVLDKCKNPNWLYGNEGENFLDQPIKPFVPFNVDNDGSHWLDKTSPVEQAIPQQEILNKIGRQIVDNISTANGFKAFAASFMTKDDVQNLTGDPNQSMVGKLRPGESLDDVIKMFPPQIISAEAIGQLQDARQVIHDILGTPDQFTGSDQDQSKTASQAQMIKNQASGRQDKIVRSIDYGMDTVFKLLTQLMTVWYTEKHYATVNGGDGKFDFVEMHKSKIEKGMTVRVQSGTTLPFDKARQEAVAQNAAELGLMAPYDYYRLMHMEDPQSLYDNLVKWKTQPQDLAMDLATNKADTQAIVDFTELMAGKKPTQRDDPTPEYIEQMRKLMITDEFLNAKKPIQNAVITFVTKASDSLGLRTELDALSTPPEPPVPQQVMATGFTPPPMPQMPGMPMGQPPPGSPIQAAMQTAGQPGAPLPGVAPLGQPQGQPSAPGLNAQPQVNAANPGQLPPF